MIIRWTQRRKKEIAQQVLEGTLSFEAALEKYNLSKDELREWLGRLACGDSFKASFVRRVRS